MPDDVDTSFPYHETSKLFAARIRGQPLRPPSRLPSIENLVMVAPNDARYAERMEERSIASQETNRWQAALFLFPPGLGAVEQDF